MAKQFSAHEKKLLSIFKPNEIFYYNGEKYIIEFAGKPMPPKGESKTDVFVGVRKLSTNKPLSIKISYKKNNAEFLENKIKAERAKQLLGCDWENILKNSIKNIKNDLLNSKLIYIKGKYPTKPGSITLGWKFEILTVANRKLSGKLIVPKEKTAEIIKDVYSGIHLPDDKKHCFVGKNQIENSGIANTILWGDIKNSFSVQDIIDKLIPIEKFIIDHPNIYFACTGCNYRILEDKCDGKRSLLIYVNWTINKGKLCSEIVFDNPLKYVATDIMDNLKNCLNKLNINSIDDFNSNKILNTTIINQ
ncbi:hypothetical protein CLOACE_14480 [Clostridium acetireducens DSM 10703]|uniref:Uncharacterized protein n=1 Tax=Clostridium acetireducens DSM 10703 TaxID=1121290 RepID=A0A1E8EY82_9CLOT|nr:hypothetical protein [Clostridium acetireducens]OFI05903.1 hypothetical protein CLOACE_14480 [Clostridium acetireducens DSM 10703]